MRGQTSCPCHLLFQTVKDLMKYPGRQRIQFMWMSVSLSLFSFFFFLVGLPRKHFSTFPSFVPLKVILHDVDAKICSEYRDVPVLKPPKPVSSWVRLFEKEKTRQQGNWPVSSILCQLKKNHSHTHISYAGFASKLKHAHCGDKTHTSKETYLLFVI